MKKIKILIPVYNDWQSVFKLLENIDSEVKYWDAEVSVLIVNDASTIEKPVKIFTFKKLKSVAVVNMKKNNGHARSIALGLKYLNNDGDFDYIVPLDGDGEDRPEELGLLFDNAKKNFNKVIVAERIKRSEGLLFQTLYSLHKYLAVITTGKLINFGNFSCLTKNDLEILSTKASLWSSFSGSFKKYIKKYNEINSIRGMRYFGPSQMSLFNLIVHSLSIIAVFKYRVFLSSFVLILLFQYLAMLFSFNFLFFQTMLILFNLFVFIISFRESETDLKNSDSNIKNIEEYTH